MGIHQTRKWYTFIYTSFDPSNAISQFVGMGLKKADPDVFFLDVLAVTATRFRPLNRMGDRTMEHPQNVHLAKILTVNKELLVLGADKECVPPPPHLFSAGLQY